MISKTQPLTIVAFASLIIMNGYLILSSRNTVKSVEEVKQSTREIVGTIEHLKRDIGQVQSEVRQLTAIKVAEKIEVTDEERKCLIKNVFHEAGVESLDGKIAVAQVVLERKETGRWGENLCSVIYARAQFSWTLKKSLVKQKPKGKLWDESVHAVEKFIKGYRVPELADAKFYHTDYIRTPYWVNEKKKIGQIGRHIFYTSSL